MWKSLSPNRSMTPNNNKNNISFESKGVMASNEFYEQLKKLHLKSSSNILKDSNYNSINISTINSSKSILNYRLPTEEFSKEPRDQNELICNRIISNGIDLNKAHRAELYKRCSKCYFKMIKPIPVLEKQKFLYIKYNCFSNKNRQSLHNSHLIESPKKNMVNNNSTKNINCMSLRSIIDKDISKNNLFKVKLKYNSPKPSSSNSSCNKMKKIKIKNPLNLKLNGDCCRNIINRCLEYKRDIWGNHLPCTPFQENKNALDRMAMFQVLFNKKMKKNNFYPVYNSNLVKSVEILNHSKQNDN